MPAASFGGGGLGQLDITNMSYEEYLAAQQRAGNL